MPPSEGNFQQQFFVVVVVFVDNLFYFIKRIESGCHVSITILNGHENLQLARARRSCAKPAQEPQDVPAHGYEGRSTPGHHVGNRWIGRVRSRGEEIYILIFHKRQGGLRPGSSGGRGVDGLDLTVKY